LYYCDCQFLQNGNSSNIIYQPVFSFATERAGGKKEEKKRERRGGRKTILSFAAFFSHHFVVPLFSVYSVYVVGTCQHNECTSQQMNEVSSFFNVPHGNIKLSP
jgi:hypothetical protein